MLFRENYTAETYSAAQNSKADYFDKVADALKIGSEIFVLLDGKNARDPYERSQKSFNRRNKGNELISRVHDEVIETEELLSMMREAKEECETQRIQ